MNGEISKTQQSPGRQGEESVGSRYDPEMRDKALAECAKMVEVAKTQREMIRKMEADQDGSEE